MGKQKGKWPEVEFQPARPDGARFRLSIPPLFRIQSRGFHLALVMNILIIFTWPRAITVPRRAVAYI